MSRRALAGALVLALSTPAAASDFWAPDQAETEPAELDALIETGALLGLSARQLKTRAANASSPLQRRQDRAKMKRDGERAIEILERAVELDPEDANLHFALAQYYYEFIYDYYEKDLPMAGRLAEAGKAAIAHWDRFEQLSPKDPRRLNFVRNAYPSSPLSGQTNLLRYPFQFERSLIYTKLGGNENWEKAVEDYDYCLAVAPPDAAPADWTAQLLTNSAEILMALGRLDEAIERYEEAFDYVNDTLYMYGLAVAYDRNGLTERALDLIRDAVVIERAGRNNAGPMSSLSRNGVFFIPNGDVHYYYALGYEAQGDAVNAVLHFRAFLDQVEDSPYADRARQHIKQLTKRDQRRRKERARKRSR